ncbi:MAG: EMC3/TMCO1 family protein [Methanomicrobiales archaeon]|nr:EMC3/TMCO1 family protein [Methanomicrobiales archaeon]
MNLKDSGGIIALALAFILLLSYSIPLMRNAIGAGMDAPLGPLLAAGVPFYVVILILSAFTGIATSLIQKYTIDYEKTQEVQARAKEFQREYREAQLSGDEKRIKKLEVKRDRMMAEQLEMSRQQFKPMGYIMVISIPIFLWLLYRLPLLSDSMIVFPYLGAKTLSEAAIWIIPTWILWYMICSLALSQVIRKAMNIGGI